MCTIYDPLGQTHNNASSDHYSHLKFSIFFFKVRDGRIDTTYENSDHYRPVTMGQPCGSIYSRQSSSDLYVKSLNYIAYQLHVDWDFQQHSNSQ